jgi:hypothetical protein
MLKYVPIDSCLDNSFFPRPLRKESDDSDTLSYFLDAYRLLNLPLQYESKIAVLPISTHNVELPLDIHAVNLVTYLNSDLCADINSENLLPVLNDADYNIFYRIWQDNHFDNEKFLPMRNVGNSSTILCNCCNNPMFNRCSETYSITPAKTLMTSMKTGFICLSYDAEIKDNEGRFLIIDSIEVKRFLGLYAQSMHWLSRSSSKEEQAFSMYKELLRMTEIAMKKARGIQIMKGINISEIDQITGTQTYNQRLVRSGSDFYKKYTTNG